MTTEFLFGMFFGGIGVAGMVSCYLSKYRETPDDDYEQKSIMGDLEHNSGNTDEYFDAETGSEINIMTEQRLKSIEDTLVLLRNEMASMKRNRSKNRISIRLDQPGTHCNQMHYCHQSTPSTCWAHPMPGSQPVHSVSMSPPPPVHSVPMPPPPPPTAPAGFELPPPPPPPPMMTTGTRAFRKDSEKTVEDGSSSVMAGPDKKPPVVYGRIPITTEMLKSVVLKPTGERILKK